MEKKTYYVSVGAKEISQVRDYALSQFEIEATEDEIFHLREMFDEVYSADWLSFWRSHVPYVQYHHDQENDMIDENVKQIYKLIYDLGTSDTKSQIESLGII